MTWFLIFWLYAGGVSETITNPVVLVFESEGDCISAWNKIAAANNSIDVKIRGVCVHR
jgi:hypothetical protein